MIIDLSDEEKQEITNRLKQEGYSKGDRVSVVGKEKSSLRCFLAKKAPVVKGKKSIETLLEELGYETRRISNLQDKLIQEFKKELPLERIENALAGKEKLPRWRQLRKKIKYIDTYNLRIRRGGELQPIRKVIDSLYPAHPHLSFLVTGYACLEDMSIEEGRRILVERYYRGEEISSGKIRAGEPFLTSWVLRYGNRERKEQKLVKTIRISNSVTKAIAELTGIKPVNFSIRASKKTKKLGTVSEGLVKIVLKTCIALNDRYARKQTPTFRKNFLFPMLNVYPVKPKKEDNQRKGVKLILKPENKEDKRIYADAVVETPEQAVMVEVKNLSNAEPHVLKGLKERFTNRRALYWRFRRKEKPIAKKTLFVHSPKDVLKEIKTCLAGTDVSTVSPSAFESMLEKSLHELRDEGYLRTQVYSPNEILDAYNLLVNSSYMLTRQSHKQQWNFLNKITYELLYRLENQEKVKKEKPPEIYSTKGKLSTNIAGLHEHYRLSLNHLSQKDFPYIEIKNYVQERLSKLPENIMFMDVESTGFVGNLIFLIGTARREADDLKFDLAFARNPWEEKAILRHFYTHSKNKLIATYNGTSFDYPAIKDRMQANMVKEELPEKHFDIYRALEKANARRKHKLENLKLKDLFVLFGDKREDIPGQEVPLLYNSWITYGHPESIKKVLEHNVLDLVTTAAVYLSPDLIIPNNNFNNVH